MKALQDCYLYGIVDLGYVTPGDAPGVTRQMLAGGVDIVQIRAKRVLAPVIVALAEEIAPTCRDHGAPLIINDYPWLVSRCGAAGCHLGQDDGPLAAARLKAGSESLVGRSTHGLAQARAARDEGADYLGLDQSLPRPPNPTTTPSASPTWARPITKSSTDQSFASAASSWKILSASWRPARSEWWWSPGCCKRPT